LGETIMLGRFYEDNDGFVWCVFAHDPRSAKPFRAVQVRTHTILSFFADGNESVSGISRHNFRYRVQPDAWGKFHAMNCHRDMCICNPDKGGV
jgi:hypothetical protein